MRLASIVFIFDSQDRVLTGLKRKSYGAGFRSLPGGGIDPGESPEDAAVREVMEEAGIRISPQDLLSFGQVEFSWEDNPSKTHRSHVFVAHVQSAEVCESEEMKDLHWHSRNEFPFEKLTPKNRPLFRAVLNGERVDRRFVFRGDEHIRTEAL